MDNLEKRNCTCGKEFEVSKFAPKTTACPECAITKLANKRREKKTLDKVIEALPKYEPQINVEKDDFDSDPFRIIEVYNLFGKEAVYVWLLLRGFSVARSGVLFKQYGTIHAIAPLNDSVKFIVSMLDKPETAITIESVSDVEDLPESIMGDLLPIASLLWPKGQGGTK